MPRSMFFPQIRMKQTPPGREGTKGDTKERGVNKLRGKYIGAVVLESDLAVVNLSWVLTFCHRNYTKFVTLQEILTMK